LGLTCLAYLWQRDQVELLDEMAAVGMECAIIKVAGAGLQTRHLGLNVLGSEMRSTLRLLVCRSFAIPFKLTAA
jgi:diphthine-ammonia ligase